MNDERLVINFEPCWSSPFTIHPYLWYRQRTMKKIVPNPTNPTLTRQITARDQTGAQTDLCVIEERPLTIFLNGTEIITAMTIGDYPHWLALGFLRNQGMLSANETIIAADYDEDLQTIVLRTDGQSDYEKKLQKKIRTSGCAMGTIFGDVMDTIETVTLPQVKIRTSWLFALAAQINTTPSLYLTAGAIHGTTLCKETEPLVYMEDVGRHNAVDKIAGWMFETGTTGADKILYTTGRLTSEMVIKAAIMGVPVLVSRSGFTAWGVELANKTGMTLIGRLRGKRFLCISGQERLIYDEDGS